MLLATTAAAQKAEPPRPIIDVHVHVYGEDPRWLARVPNPATGEPPVATNGRAHMLATFEEMRRHNVVKAFVSNYYDVALRWKTAAPGLVVASYGFDEPSSVDLNFLRREHAAGRLQALGEIGAQYEGLAASDPALEPIFALAEELDLPVGLHLGLSEPGRVYEVSPKYRAGLGDPLMLEDVLVRHPKLRVFVMHAGWPMTDQMVALMWAHPQVYVDIAVINWALPRAEFHSYLRRLVNSGFAKRIMFGSDQMVWPEAIGLAIEGVESATFLTEEQKGDIFHDNAVRFFGLEEE